MLNLWEPHELCQRGAHSLGMVPAYRSSQQRPFARSLARTGGLGLIISVMSPLSPVAIGVLTAYSCNFIGRGVKSDSSPLRLDWWLHRLLVWGCWPIPRGWGWLAQGWHHLRSLQQWCLRGGLRWWSPWHLSPQGLNMPFYSRPHHAGPPHRRPVSQGCR